MSRGAIILIAASLLFLGLPAIRGLFEDTKKRELIENRALAPFPDFEIQSVLEGTFFPELDLYLSDHFGYSRKLHRFHQSIVYFAFRDDPVPNLTLGRDGFVFLNSHDRDTPYEAFERLCLEGGSGADFSAIGHQWRGVLDNLNKQGYRTVLAIVPSKPVIYPEMLPRRVPQALRQACLEYGVRDNALMKLRRDATRQGLAIYYPFEAFSAARFDGNFYPKENFHWAGESIHLFMKGLFDTLEITPTQAYVAGARTTETKAELSRILGVRLTATITDYDYADFGVIQKRREPSFIRQWYERAGDFGESWTDNPMTSRTALLIGNSFGAFAVKHLAPAYRRVVQINVNNLLPTEGARFLEEVVRQIAPDDVIFLFHDEAATAEGKRMYGYLFDDS